jgi:hypothetical protein
VTFRIDPPAGVTLTRAAILLDASGLAVSASALATADAGLTDATCEPAPDVDANAVRCTGPEAPIGTNSELWLYLAVAKGAKATTYAGRLDPDTALTHRLPELPRWAAAVRLRHLVHPHGGTARGRRTPRLGRPHHRAVLAALARLPSPPRPPGRAFVYSNAGYVCLARAVERAAGQPLAAFARDHLFVPLGLPDTLFWTGPGPAPPASRPTSPAHPAPLSLGDGGLCPRPRTCCAGATR